MKAKRARLGEIPKSEPSIEHDIYFSDALEHLADEDVITPGDAGFMAGYLGA